MKNQFFFRVLIFNELDSVVKGAIYNKKEAPLKNLGRCNNEFIVPEKKYSGTIHSI